MLFSKLRHKDEELLPPPPPPFPSMELEEEKKPELFDEIIKPKKAKASPEEDEFSGLLKEMGDLKPKKAVKKEKAAKKLLLKKIPAKKLEIKKQILKPIKEKKIKLKKPAIKQLKIPVKKIAPIKPLKEKAQLKKIKERKLPLKQIKAIRKETKAELPELEDLELEHEFGLPRELDFEKEIGLPETLEDFDIGKGLDVDEELEEHLGQEIKAKPKEILEAEEEIKSAIEKIKYHEEKQPFFSRLFAKTKGLEEKPSGFLPDIKADDVSKMQWYISRAREALMKFDLETAKKSYIEIMRVYNKIKPEEQAKVYHDIRDLYFERKSAEELKV